MEYDCKRRSSSSRESDTDSAHPLLNSSKESFKNMTKSIPSKEVIAKYTATGCSPFIWLKRGCFCAFVVIFVVTFCLTLAYETRIPKAGAEVISKIIQPVIQGFSDEEAVTDGNIISKDYRLVIKVLAYNRLESLRRCLWSLAKADYAGDRVLLHIFIDHFKLPTYQSHDVSPEVQEMDEILNPDSTDEQLNLSHSMLQLVEAFNWPHGQKEVHYRTQNAGLQGQWLEAWWPVSDDEFALVVEDDMELSPLYYRYIRGVIANYYYNPANYDRSIFGVSLQRPRFVTGKGGNPLKVDNDTRLFLYQMVGTWGQVLFPKPWKEFRLWYDVNKSRGIKPFLNGTRSNGWYIKLGEKIWTPWFIKFVHSRTYFNIYTNFLHDRALSISNRDEGVNYHKKAGPDSILIQKNAIADIDMWEMIPLERMKRYDLCFQEILPGRFASGLRGLGNLLSSMDAAYVIVVSITDVPLPLIRNWLCHFQKLGLNNYLMFGHKSDFLDDLARRGHPIMWLPKEDLSVVEYYHENAHTMTEIDATLKVLKLGYDVCFTRPDTLWTGNPIQNLTHEDIDIMALKSGESYSSSLMYIKSTHKAINLLEEAAKKILAHELHELGKDTFGGLLGMLQESNAVIKPFSPATDLSVVHLFQNSNVTAKIMQMRRLNLWAVDEDYACTEVFCMKRKSLQQG